MKSSRIIPVVALVLVAFVAFGAMAKTTSHGMTVHGKITALDEKAKTLTVTPSKGKAVDLTWNDATKVNGGTLKVNEMATARYLKRSGKNVATIITVPAAKTASAAPAKSAPAKPAATPTKH